MIARAIAITLLAFDVHAGCSGCCSWHGGITGACHSSGKVYCADGTVSESCSCDDCKRSTRCEKPEMFAIMTKPTWSVFKCEPYTSARSEPDSEKDRYRFLWD